MGRHSLKVIAGTISVAFNLAIQFIFNDMDKSSYILMYHD